MPPLVTHALFCWAQRPPSLPSNPPPPPPPPLLGTKEDFNTCCSSSQWTAPQRLSDPSHHLTKPQLTAKPNLQWRHRDQVQKWDTGRKQVLCGLSLETAAQIKISVSTFLATADQKQHNGGRHGWGADSKRWECISLPVWVSESDMPALWVCQGSLCRNNCTR